MRVQVWREGGTARHRVAAGEACPALRLPNARGAGPQRKLDEAFAREAEQDERAECAGDGARLSLALELIAAGLRELTMVDK
jgi:hypothetical protein